MTSTSFDNSKNLMAVYNYDNHIKRIIQELQGIASAIIYDGNIDNTEIQLLEKWLANNAEYLTQYPLTDLNILIRKITSDGAISIEERKEVFNFLSTFATAPDCDPVIEGIFCEDPVIEFNGRIFLFTGTLQFGTRKKAMDTVIKLGGECSKSSSFSLKIDYLVIGMLGSNDYKYGRFGSKIETALELIRSGKSNALIVKEKDFVKAVINHK